MDREITQVPIFPLKDTVFFPNSLLRLHVFEDRYRKMTHDCLKDNGRMVVSMMKPGWEPLYYGSPPIYRYAGLGRIVDHEKLEDGRFNITLEGSARIKILREVSQDPYRIAEAEVMNGCSVPSCDAGKEVHQAFTEMKTSIDRMLRLFPQLKPTFQKIIASHLYPGVIADLVCHHFVPDAYDKQCILEELSVHRRIQLVNIQINNIIQRFSRAQFRDRL